MFHCKDDPELRQPCVVLLESLVGSQFIQSLKGERTELTIVKNIPFPALPCSPVSWHLYFVLFCSRMMILFLANSLASVIWVLFIVVFFFPASNLDREKDFQHVKHLYSIPARA